MSDQITTGLHLGISHARYHADPCSEPSLSSGIARTIVTKSLAHARLEHVRLGGEPRKLTPALSLGAYVHALVAGDVTGFEVGDFPTFQSKAAKEWMESVYALDKEPVLQANADAAGPIADAIIAKAGLGVTNNPFAPHGQSEVTAIWQEENAWCRARFDRLVVEPNGYADIWDWKTTDDISDHGIISSICSYGYHTQVAFYMRGLSAVLPSHRGRISFVLAFAEKGNPYSVRRITLSPAFLAIGNRNVSLAIAKWQHATATQEWPEYPVDTTEVEPPAYMDDDDEITAS